MTIEVPSPQNHLELLQPIKNDLSTIFYFIFGIFSFVLNPPGIRVHLTGIKLRLEGEFY